MAATAALVLISVSILVWISVRQLLLVNTDAALLSVARSEVAHFSTPPFTARKYPETPSALELTTRRGYRQFGAIVDSTGKLVSVTTPLDLETTAVIRTIAAKAGHSPTFAITSISKLPVRIVSYRITSKAHKPMATIVAAMSLRPFLRSLNALFAVLTVTTIAGTLLSALLARYVAHRLTSPLSRIAAQARKTEAGNQGYRISDDFPDTDLSDVANALNTMLSRRDAAYSQVNELLTIQSQFSADASHELRSPLSNIRAMFEVVLKRDRPADEYRQVIKDGLEEIKRLSRVTNDLLLLARSDAGQLNLQVDNHDLADMANAACNAFAARAAVLQVGFDRKLRNILVQCDETRIREVIDNLLENAIRMAPRNSTVVVGTEQRDGVCQLWVEDRGPGVSKEEQDLIFRRFYRSDASRSRDSGGSGLGLAICRAIAEAHGGTLNASSAEAHGTRFTLSLPAAINGGLQDD